MARVEWDLQGPEGAAMQGADFDKDRPTLTRENDQVYRAWSFCGGWHPERITYAAAYFGIRDIDFLTAQLMTMHSLVEKNKRR